MAPTALAEAEEDRTCCGMYCGTGRAVSVRIVGVQLGRGAVINASFSRMARQNAFVQDSWPVVPVDDWTVAGWKGHPTNLVDQPADFVIGAYHQLRRIEKAFRMSKNDLRARPTYHHTVNR